ncbi:hypothetical protein V1508DRAFT_125528 [Lipomyces doorenjongii]|uniref:uncharacterized protein n=1 Tax=Lipomyces doorenjongii TaxID=383834 RepID=UPI0034CDE102
MMIVRPYAIVSVVLIIAIAVLSYSYFRSSDVSVFSHSSDDMHTADKTAAGEGPVDVNVAATANAKPAFKSYIIQYKSLDTPDSVVNFAMNAIKELGGSITHEYNTVMRGFTITIPSGIASAGVLAAFKEKAASKDFPFTIEEDKPIHI